MDAETIAVPIWIVGMLIFVFGVFVGKTLYEPRAPIYTRPPTPPEPEWVRGRQPAHVNTPASDNIKPPPKKP